MSETRLDAAHDAMQADPQDDAARLKFYELLADSELFLLLEREAEGAEIEPKTLAVEGLDFVLAFDREERLADFAGGPAAYAALSGRGLAALLKGQGLGLGLNLEGPAPALLPPAAMDWLAGMLEAVPEPGEGALREVRPPALPGDLMTALAAKLVRAGGLARAAVLAGVGYDDGRQGHLLGFVDAVPGAEPALAKAVAEALVFSGLEDGALDVAFVDGGSAQAARLVRAGRVFELPAPAPTEAAQMAGTAPGMDPEKPPKLR